MNLLPNEQLNLYGFEDEFKNLTFLYDRKLLPNKIVFSGEKGAGKSTLAYHLINYILSKDEEFSYNKETHKINENNRSFILTSNKTNPNLYLIDALKDKNIIEISQIRNLISTMNKSSFNKKPRFVLIDNIELMNINASNALLKILEEPNDNIFFILIQNDKNVLSTIKSRCLDFKIFLSHQKSILITNKLLKDDIKNFINEDLMNYYFTPGKYLRLLNFAKEENIDLSQINLKEFLKLSIKKNFFKKNNPIHFIFYEFIELYFIKYASTMNYRVANYYNYFVKKIEKLNQFNLDEQSLMLEFEEKFLNE